MNISKTNYWLHDFSDTRLVFVHENPNLLCTEQIEAVFITSLLNLLLFKHLYYYVTQKCYDVEIKYHLRISPRFLHGFSVYPYQSLIFLSRPIHSLLLLSLKHFVRV